MSVTVKDILFISLFSVAASAVVAQDDGKVHSFRFLDTDLRVALDSLLRWYAVPLIYLDNDVSGKRVSAECSNCGFKEALEKVISGQQLVWKSIGAQVVLQRRVPDPEASAATLAGTVRDSLTGEGVSGASVILERRAGSIDTYRWCSTNQFGFFSLRNVQSGDYVLNVRCVGYRAVIESITISPGVDVERELLFCPQDVVLPEVTVEGSRPAFTASEGISRGVYIRATPTDQNQYLFEGARVYNPVHFGGVMSTFNADAVHDIQVIAGGIPSYYGGRIGGILDVTLHDGRDEKLTGTAEVGSLGSALTLEGPLLQRTTFMASGRHGYPDIFLTNKPTTGARSDLNSIEMVTKVTHNLPGSQRLSLSGYLGRDTYDKQVNDIRGDRLSNSLRWGNAAANVRWIGVVSPSLFFHASAIYTRYAFDAEHRLAGVENSVPPQFYNSDYAIEDAAVRAHAEYFYDQYHTVLAGVELVRHWMRGSISEFSSQLAPMSLSGFSPWELSVYLQDQWRLVPSVSAELGARATSFVARQGSFSAVDPRFSLLVSLHDDLRLYSTFSSVNQFVHPFRHSGIFLFYPSIFFYPSTEYVSPSTSLQASLGAEKYLRDHQYRLAIESYYRMTQKLHEFVLDTVYNTVDDLSNALIIGEGIVYGVEATLHKRTGNFTGSIRYSFSWATNRFAELNGGEPFRPRFDRRHEVYAAISFSPFDNWAIGAMCLLSSNQFPSFAPTGLKELAQDFLVGPEVRANTQYAEPIDINGGRLPGFQRIEVRMTHGFSWWSVPIQATLRLLNGYGLIDPFVWELRQSPDVRRKWRATFDAPPLFPLYPAMNVSARF
ncbi:MAG: TonB-dependent receptor [Ignavibacteriae bacterium]|nr:TonB-dependent receptor [Ignavibacteriota bacterium]